MIHKVRKLWSKTNRWHRVFMLLFIVEMGWLPGKLAGFQCNDPALSHTFAGDTVSWKWLLGVSSLLPLPVILIIERTHHKQEPSRERAKRRALRWFSEFYFGFLINLTVVELLKRLYGAPRPHFFDTCKPQEALTCQESEYVTKYMCSETSWTMQSNRSFPSGHASLAIYSAVFVAYYLHCRTQSAAGRTAAQVVFVVTGVLVSLSRMMDHRHHWWDVLTGATWGLIMALYAVWSCRNFHCGDTKDESQIKPERLDRRVSNGAVTNSSEKS